MSEQNSFSEETVRVDLSVYTMDAVLKSAYRFTGRCYVEISSTAEGFASVRIRSKSSELPASTLAAEFFNDLLDQRLRVIVADETSTVRDLIMRHALSETSFLRRDLEEAPAWEDSLGIGTPDPVHREK